jgi:hypothetical protein
VWLWLPWECECEEPFDDELSELELDDEVEDVDVDDVDEPELELSELLVDELEPSEPLEGLDAPDFPRLSVL